MRIAVVGPIYPFRGGIAHYTALLASHLAQQHQVQVFSFRRQFPSFLFPGRSQHEPGSAPVAPPETTYTLIPWWPPSWMAVAAAWRRAQPQVVVVQWWVPFMAFMTAWLAANARRAGIPVVIICHNVLPHERNPLDAALIRLGLGRASGLIVHSQRDAQAARRLLPDCPVQVIAMPRYNLLTAPLATAAEARARLDLHGATLLFFGFVRPYKGLADLLDALPAVLREQPLTLLIVGEFWTPAAEYLERARRLGIEDHIRIVDRYVSHEEAGLYFAAADAAVLPYREATGSAVTQLAFALGVPVIATRAGGIAEAIDDGVTGFLVEPGDVAGLSEAILRFYRDDCGARFRAAIAGQSEQFSWEAAAQAIDSLAQTAHAA